MCKETWTETQRKLKWEISWVIFVLFEGSRLGDSNQPSPSSEREISWVMTWSRENNGDEVVTVEAGYEPIAK